MRAPAEVDLASVLAAQTAAFRADPYPTLRRRLNNLIRLQRAVVGAREAIIQALAEDFGQRSSHETLLAEILMVSNTIRYNRAHLAGWMRPRRRHVPLVVGIGRARVTPQPLGVVGIIAPWNAPLQLALSPLVAALAAGNRVMLKPSEHAPATAALLVALLGGLFATDQVAVVAGDEMVARAFAALPFDHLLYTGSGAVGRQVMLAAAANLTPVTLELGGKSPVLIAPDADLGGAAADIVFGKLLSAGQTCIAPDFVLVPRTALRPLVEACKAAAARMYPLGCASPDYTAVINDRHLGRLTGLLEQARARGCELVPLFAASHGGAERTLAPWLVVDPPEDLGVMTEEVFGPILAIRPYDDLEQAIAFINARDRPLALYLFSKDQAVIERVSRATCSGALVVNDTLVQAAIEDLPFGGTGASGMGRYHGPEGFETFSHMKPVFERGWPRLDRMARAPFPDWKTRIFKRLL